MVDSYNEIVAQSKRSEKRVGGIKLFHFYHVTPKVNHSRSRGWSWILCIYDDELHLVGLVLVLPEKKIFESFCLRRQIPVWQQKSTQREGGENLRAKGFTNWVTNIKIFQKNLLLPSFVFLIIIYHHKNILNKQGLLLIYYRNISRLRFPLINIFFPLEIPFLVNFHNFIRSPEERGNECI